MILSPPKGQLRVCNVPPQNPRPETIIIVSVAHTSTVQIELGGYDMPLLRGAPAGAA